MPTDLTLILHDRPGELARVGEVAGSAGIHIRGVAAFTGEGRGVIHVLVDVNDRPGSLGELARELAEANVNLELAYPTFDAAQLVIVTDDMQSAREALG